MTTWASELYPETVTRDEGFDYGLGLIYQTFDAGYTVGHDGSWLSDIGTVLYFPEFDVTIVLCTNCTGTAFDPLYWELVPEMVAAVFTE